jgi:hypothetical protein
LLCARLTRPWQSIDAVPGELRKNMQAIRSYDVKQQALHAQLQAEQSSFVAEAKRRTDAGEEVDDEALQALKEQYRTVLALCDKKVRIVFSSRVLIWFRQVNLANNSYQLLDEAIRKLDTELRKFESELEQKELNLTAAERRKRKASLGIGAAEQRRMYAGSGEAFPRSDRKRVQVTRQRGGKVIVLTLSAGIGWCGSHVRRGDGHAGGSQRADVLHLPARVVWRNGRMRQSRVSARVVSLRVRGALGQSQGQVALPRVLGRRPQTQTPGMKKNVTFLRHDCL